MRPPYDGKCHRPPVERGWPIAMRAMLTPAPAAALASVGAKNLSPFLLFVFMTFRIDRGAKYEAQAVAQETLTQALEEARKIAKGATSIAEKEAKAVAKEEARKIAIEEVERRWKAGAK